MVLGFLQFAEKRERRPITEEQPTAYDWVKNDIILFVPAWFTESQKAAAGQMQARIDRRTFEFESPGERLYYIKDHPADLFCEIPPILRDIWQKHRFGLFMKRWKELKATQLDCFAAQIGNSFCLIAILIPDSRQRELTAFEQRMFDGRLLSDKNRQRVDSFESNTCRNGTPMWSDVSKIQRFISV